MAWHDSPGSSARSVAAAEPPEPAKMSELKARGNHSRWAKGVLYEFSVQAQRPATYVLGRSS